MNPHFYFFGCLVLAFQLLGLAAEPHEDDSTPAQRADTNSYQTRLAWHRRTIVNGYDTVGKHDAKWDKPVRAVLEEWARMRADPISFTSAELRKFKKDVIDAGRTGCDDPYFVYVHAKYVPSAEATNSLGRAREAVRLAEALKRSRYSQWLKFFAHLRAAQALSNAVTLNTNLLAELRIERYEARTNLWEVMREGAAPVEEVYAAFKELLDQVASSSSLFQFFYARMEPDLFRSYSNHYLPWLLKGDYYVSFAWKARGNALADKVPESAWPLFQQRLETANEALQRAWSMNSNEARIAVTAMRADLGMSRGRDHLEKWFERAMAADPGNLSACRAKIQYLEPQWHGSPEEMLAFGNECATSKQWKGRVPLALAYAHDRLVRYRPRNEQPKYWLQPEVWKDIKTSYDTFFQRNPDAQHEHAEFARYAYWCGQWDEFLRQFGLLKERHESFFGGKEELDRMIRRAKEKSAKSEE